MKYPIKVHLASFGPSDFQRLINWVNNGVQMTQFADPEVFPLPLTEDSLHNYIADSNRHAYKIVNSESGSVAGHAEIYMKENQTALLCRILIGDESNRGKGIGQQIIPALCDIAIGQLGAGLVELNVYDWNTGAIKCYEKSGFEINQDIYTDLVMDGQSCRSLNLVLKR